MRLLRDVPIRRKLTVITMLTSCVALLLACVAFVTYEQVTFRATMVSDLSSTARMIGDNSSAALSFNDPGSAEQTLKSLSAHPHIVGGAIYDKEGKPFASYLRAGLPGKLIAPSVEPDGHRFGNNQLEMFQKITLAGEAAGVVYIQSDLSEMRARLWRYAMIVLAVMLAASLAAFVLSTTLQKIISEPISQLAKVAGAVATGRDYSLRAIKQSEDELGQLIDGFNEMLTQIQARDVHLQQAQDLLEKRVEERTSALQSEVAERQRSEEAMRETNQRFEIVTRATTDVIWDRNLKSNALWWNENFQTVFGYSPTEVGSDMAGWTDRIHPDDLPGILQSIHKVIDGGGHLWSSEYRFRRRDGSYAFVFDRGYVLRDEQGKSVRMIGAMQDFTERKNSEAQLLESQRFLQSTLDALSAHIAILDETGTIVAVNAVWRRFAESNGFGGQQWGVGGNYLKVCDSASGDCASESAAVAAGIRKVMSREQSDFQLEYPCHSPEEQRWFVIRVTRFSGDGPVRIVVAHEDITERKHAEEALREGEARIRTIVDTALDAVVTMDAAGVIADWNPQAAVMFGWSRDEAVGRRLSETIIPPQYREAHERGLARFLVTGHGPVLNKRIEITALHRDGRKMDIELAVTPLKTGRQIAFSAFIRDITERKRAEAELEQAHRQLLDVSRQAGMAEVATGVLHNVGNVLNSVNVSATLLTDSLKKSKAANLGKAVALMREHATDLGGFLTSDPKGKQLPGYLGQLAEHLVAEQGVILNEVDSLRKNIEHIKEIVAMQQSYAKVSGVAEIIKVTDLVEDSLRMNAAALARHNIQVVRDYEEVPAISVEKHKILQILVNLIRNAKYACDESEQADKQVTIRVTQLPDRVRIAVSDNGIGIPPENLTRIFAHGFTTKATGHGFGLHSGALAAKEMGGSLNVHSEGPGKGATFILELPLETSRQLAA